LACRREKRSVSGHIVLATRSDGRELTGDEARPYQTVAAANAMMTATECAVNPHKACFGVDRKLRIRVG